MEIYSEGLATCLNVTWAGHVRYHVHQMAGSSGPAYVMVRVASGKNVNQSEWFVPGTLDCREC